MRAIIALLLFASIQPAAADKLRPVPVKTVGEAYFCKTYEMLMLRRQMIDRRDAASQQSFEVTSGPFGGQCGRIGDNKWMFYTGVSNDSNYVALRFAIEGSDVWVSKESVGPIPTIVPGRSLKQANKGTGCKEWEPIAKQARERAERLSAELRGRYQSKSFFESTLETAAGVKDSVGLCEATYLRLIDYNRERVAILNCPKLDAGDRKSWLDRNMDGAEDILTRSCLPKNQ